MADTTRIVVEKLNGHNYQLWKYKLELLLMKEDVWSVVTGPTPTEPNEAWIRKDQKARATIGLLVENDQTRIIRNQSTAKGYWDALRDHHEKATISNSLTVLKRLCRASLEEGGDMEKHIDDLLELVDRLTALGDSLPERLVVALILNSVPESYQPLVMALEVRPRDEITLELIRDKFIQEYKRRIESQAIKQTDEAALKMGLKYDKRDGTKRRSVCFYCEKTGHFKRDCALYKAELKHRLHRANTITEGVPDLCETNSDEDQACFKIGYGPLQMGWYIDSGATAHMTNDKNFFEGLDMEIQDKVVTANGSVLKTSGRGNGTLNCTSIDGKIRSINVKDVLYVPDLDGSLLSVRMLTKHGLTVKFDDDLCYIFKQGEVIAVAREDNQLYKLQCRPNDVALVTCSQIGKSCIHTWHSRMGHRGPKAIHRLVDEKLAAGIVISKCSEHNTCEVCLKGKMTRKPFPKHSNTTTSHPFELVHSDLCGPMNNQTPGGKRYFMTFVDDYSRFCMVFLLTHKNEAFNVFKRFRKLVKTRYERNVKIIRTDRGGEYVGNYFKEYLIKKGIKHQMTTAYTPEQNGVAERKNCTLVEMAKCMLTEAVMDNKYWGEAICTANYLQNRLPTKEIDMTPFQKLTNQLPNLTHIRTFGSIAYAHVPKQIRKKFDDKARQLRFVGYANGSKAYRLLDMATNRVQLSRDVVFIETIPMHNSVGHTVEYDVTAEDLDANIDTQMNERIGPISNETQPKLINDEALRRSQRENFGKAPLRYAWKLHMYRDEPDCYEAAISDDDSENWKNAMKTEMESLQNHQVWELAELPVNKRAVGSKWVFKLKRDETGKINRYKARLVAQGYSQKFGHDFDEVFAPVVKQTTLRVLLVIACRLNLLVKHYDVETAFLNGDLQEEIFMQQPKGFIKKGNEHLVCRLKKGVYGLKQAARVWNQHINNLLVSNGFRRGEADPCLYITCIDGILLYLIIYVDDIIIVCKHEHIMKTIEKLIKTVCQLNCLGDLCMYVGIKIERKKDHFCLHQSIYIDKIIARFELENAKPSNVPLDLGYMKQNVEHNPMPSNELYRSAIGSLLYVAINTRPDIAACVSILSQKVSAPNYSDWTEVKRVIRYLKTTRDLCLVLGENQSARQEGLIGFADADWAGDYSDRKSRSGYVFQIDGNTISWGSKKQSTVALSSTEAEYVGLAEACQEAKWLIRLAVDLDYEIMLPITIFEDNQSCLRIAESERITSRTKHLDVKYHFVRNLCSSGEIRFEYCPTSEMMADIMTKPLQRMKIRIMTQLLGLSI